MACPIPSLIGSDSGSRRGRWFDVHSKDKKKESYNIPGNYIYIYIVIKKPEILMNLIFE